MIDERFPNWEIDVEKGTIYSLYWNKYIGTIDVHGYVKVNPPKGYKHSKLHQYIWIVANGCDIPEGYDIHHIDHNPLNNSIYNLELVEQHKHRSEHNKGKILSEKHKMNLSESHKGKILSEKHKMNLSESHKGKTLSDEIKMILKDKLTNNPKLSKQVAQYTLNGELVKVWDSTMEIERCLEFKHSSISLCCNGKYKTAYGYIWKYYNEERDVA